jgi:hypothetical protein
MAYRPRRMRREARERVIAASVKTVSSCTRTDVVYFPPVASGNAIQYGAQPRFAFSGKPFTLRAFLQSNPARRSNLCFGYQLLNNLYKNDTHGQFL